MISSLTNEIVKYLVKLKEKKYRQEFHEFIVEGEHMVQEAILLGRCKTVFTINEEATYHVETVVVSPEVMNKISDVLTPPGVVGLCIMDRFPKWTEKILILDGIQDPGNLGTLLRSAAAFGFHSVISENSVDIYNPKVLRSTQGGIFKIGWAEKNILGFIENHPEYTYIGTTVSNGIPLRKLESISGKIAIILGNEASGVREEIQSLSTKLVTIEMENTESLNVGVAGSILMYHLSN
ncbi:MAG: RNA methyltransferase [Firmicutes bacterium]|nr:RNA methyltransferase [Bacillota bacterium]